MATEERPGFSTHNSRLARPPNGLLSRVLAFILGAGFLVLAFMFSLVALAVLAIGGLAVGGWLWWKTRAIRQQMRAMQKEMHDVGQTHSPATGHVIEGEVIRESSAPARPEHLLR